MGFGGEIVSKGYTVKGRENYDRIFGRVDKYKIDKTKKPSPNIAVNRAILASDSGKGN